MLPPREPAQDTRKEKAMALKEDDGPAPALRVLLYPTIRFLFHFFRPPKAPSATPWSVPYQCLLKNPKERTSRDSGGPRSGSGGPWPFLLLLFFRSKEAALSRKQLKPVIVPGQPVLGRRMKRPHPLMGPGQKLRTKSKSRSKEVGFL